MNKYNVNEIIKLINDGNINLKHNIIPIVEEVYTINELPFRKYDLLSIVCVLIEQNKLEDAEQLLKMTQNLYSNKADSTSFDRISDSLYDLILYENIKKDELYYQEVFKKHCEEILGSGYKLYNKKDLESKRPDAWILYDEVIIPVEMKVGNFNETALKQLLNYMKIYKCSYGIAIGSKPTVEIPENIIFIKIDEVKKFDK